MAVVFYEHRDRPGVHPVIGSLRGVPETESGGGGTAATNSLYITTEGVLASRGATPKMEGNTLVYEPTPAMAENVMTIS